MGCFRLSCCLKVFFIILFFLVIYQLISERSNIVYLKNWNMKTDRKLFDHKNLNLTCNWSADQRGYHQKVIGYSMYGDFLKPKTVQRYLVPLKQTIKKTSQLYPGWTVRIYHNFTFENGNSSWKVFNDFIGDNHSHVDLCNASNVIKHHNLGDLFAMTWRWLPLLDERVDVFMSRDADSLMLPRENLAVQEWLASDRHFHIMRDNPQHCIPILGGLWGVKVGQDRSRILRSADSIFRVNHLQKRGYDQTLLERHLWPIARSNMMAHDSYCCKNFQPTEPFSSQRKDGAFVGMVAYLDHFNAPKCPKECRPQGRLHWNYC